MIQFFAPKYFEKYSLYYQLRENEIGIKNLAVKIKLIIINNFHLSVDQLIDYLTNQLLSKIFQLLTGDKVANM